MTVTVPIRGTDEGIEPDLPEGTPYTNAAYNIEAGTVTVTVPPGTPVPGRLTRGAWLRRLAPHEYAAIEAASDPYVRYFRKLGEVSEYIRLDDPELIAGLHYMHHVAGIIEPEARIDELLAV